MTIDKGWEAVEERKWDNAFHLLSGVKYRPDLQPERPYHEPWQKAIREDSAMYDLYVQYRNIPLYRGLTAQEGNFAAVGLMKIGKKVAMIMDYAPEYRSRPNEAWNKAAQIIEEMDPDAAYWASYVRSRPWLNQDRRARDRFMDSHPDFASIMRGEPIAEALRGLRSVGIQPQLPSLRR
jgi:hypothetical protein